MARTVGSGQTFFGLPTVPSRVLYLEVDTPEQVIQDRLKKIPPSQGVWWLFMSPLSVPYLSDEQAAALREAKEEVRPEVVFVNTLRKVHDLDDTTSKAPKVVYSFFQRTFPGAALVFVHHMRKSPQDPKMVDHEKEGFSGSQAWLNDVQCGLHLEEFDGERENLRLYHRKSQVSRTLKPLPLKLTEGVHLGSPLYDDLLLTYEKIHEDGFLDLPAGEQDQALAKALGTSITTAKRRRLTVLGGDFPGSHRWLLTD